MNENKKLEIVIPEGKTLTREEVREWLKNNKPDFLKKKI